MPNDIIPPCYREITRGVEAIISPITEVPYIKKMRSEESTNNKINNNKSDVLLDDVLLDDETIITVRNHLSDYEFYKQHIPIIVNAVISKRKGCLSFIRDAAILVFQSFILTI